MIMHMFEKECYFCREWYDENNFTGCLECGTLVCPNCIDTSSDGDPVCPACWGVDQDEL